MTEFIKTRSSELVARLQKSIAPFEGMAWRTVAALTTIAQVSEAADRLLALEAEIVRMRANGHCAPTIAGDSNEGEGS